VNATDERGRLPPPALSSLTLNSAAEKERPFPEPQSRAVRRPVALALGILSSLAMIPIITMTVPQIWYSVRAEGNILWAMSVALLIGGAFCARTLRDWYALFMPSLHFSDEVMHELGRCGVGRWPTTGFFLAALAIFVFITPSPTWYETSGIVALIIVPSLRAALVAWRFPDPDHVGRREASWYGNDMPVSIRRALVASGVAACVALVMIYVVPGVSGRATAMAGSLCFVLVCAWTMWLTTRPVSAAPIPVSWSSNLPLLSVYASVSGIVVHALPSTVNLIVLALGLVLSLSFDLERAWRKDQADTGMLFAPK
jgi:hypothetical protein